MAVLGNRFGVAAGEWHAAPMWRRLCLTILSVVAAACSSRPTTTAPPVPAGPDLLVYAVEAPGRTSVEIDRDIATLVDRALTGTPHVTRVEIVSRAGGLQAHCILEPGTSALSLRGPLLTRLLAVLASTDSTVAPVRAGAGRPLSYTLRSGDADQLALSRWQDAAMPSLQSVPGVLDVETCGTVRGEVRVNVDAARLVATGLGLDSILGALRGPYPSVEAISARDLGGVPQVLVGQVATVATAAAAPECRALRDGSPAQLVVARIGASIDAEQVRRAIAASLAQSGAPPDVRIEPLSPRGPVTTLSMLLPEGASWEAAVRSAQAATEAVRRVPGIAHVVARVGASDQRPAGPRQTDLEIELPPTAADAASRVLIERALINAVHALPDVQVRVPDGALAEKIVRVSGDDLEALGRVATALVAKLRTTPGVEDAGALDVYRSTTVSVRLDPTATDQHIDPHAAERAVAAATDGIVTGTLVTGTRRQPIRVVLGRSTVATTELPPDFAIPIRGGLVPLASIGRLETMALPEVVVRENGHLLVRVWMRLTSEAALGAVRGVVSAAVPVPAGVSIVW